MKIMMYFIIGLLLSGCSPDTDVAGNTEDFSGDYIGFTGFKNTETGRVHLGQTYVKVESIDGGFFVTTTEPSYEILSSGFGQGAEDKVDTTFITEKDTAKIAQVIDTLFTRRIKTEQVQIQGDKMDWSATIRTITRKSSGATTDQTVIGKGEIQKVN